MNKHYVQLLNGFHGGSEGGRQAVAEFVFELILLCYNLSTWHVELNRCCCY